MRQLIPLTLMALVSATQAIAACAGDDVRTRLSAAERLEVTTAAAATPYGSGTIWTATRGDDRITIAGTMHLYDPRLAPIAVQLSPAITAADLLLVEAGPEEEAAMADAIASDPSLLFLTDGNSLTDLMEPEAFIALSRAVEARGLPAAAAAQMQPWYLSLTLAMPTCALADLQQGRQGLDAKLIDIALAADIDVQAVEPWDTIFSLMSADPIDDQIDALNLSFMPEDLANAMNATMLDSYFSGEIAELWELSRVVSRQVPGLAPEEADTLFAQMEDDLLTRRNLDWMPVIANAAEAHDTIVLAVGAGHLPGAQGVLRLLETDGWTITPGL
ncbi:TraB/GumN family protein [Loktanella sp. TSTF-M6]|uniref:TraB/GumN family protein n=1 Tax=Loktanella gaetbuli TaxID=2881335 RepID=A0ABS8BX97_9RHOB|nr:TraB/GumN family protein [Loktanella gaetbuli]MCB5200363.1 TraB/GumN family protein [Loktanella gaetbuli]